MLGCFISDAAQGDCSQPVSGGTSPTAADCLFILRAAVGAETCEPICVCDTTGAGGATAGDALLCLKKAVGQGVTLQCPIPCGTVTTSTSTTSSSTSSSTSTSFSSTTTTLLGLQALEGSVDESVATVSAKEPRKAARKPAAVNRTPLAGAAPFAELIPVVAADVEPQMCSLSL
jgi:hypothetical protein